MRDAGPGALAADHGRRRPREEFGPNSLSRYLSPNPRNCPGFVPPFQAEPAQAAEILRQLSPYNRVHRPCHGARLRRQPRSPCSPASAGCAWLRAASGGVPPGCDRTALRGHAIASGRRASRHADHAAGGSNKRRLLQPGLIPLYDPDHIRRYRRPTVGEPSCHAKQVSRSSKPSAANRPKSPSSSRSPRPGNATVRSRMTRSGATFWVRLSSKLCAQTPRVCSRNR